RVYRVGSLIAGAPVADNSPLGAALIRGLAQRGYTLDRNLTFEHRGAEMHVDQLPRLVDELVTSKVDVIVAFGYPATLAAKEGRPFRWCHSQRAIRLALDWWTAWRDRAATSRASRTCRRRLRPSGWSFSRKWLPRCAAWRCCGMQPILA